MTELSSFERIVKAIQLQKPDRVPVIPILMNRAIRVINATTAEAVKDGKVMAEAKIAANRKFGGDAVIAGTGLFVEAENLGAECEYLPTSIPIVLEPLLKDKELSEFPRFDPKRGRVKAVSDEIDVLGDHFGNSLVIAVAVSGPMTLGVNLRGQEFYLDMEDDPQYVQRLMALTTEVINDYVNYLMDHPVASIAVLDPSCSSDVISPEMYRKLVFPFHQKIMENIKAKGRVPLLHICTNTEPIWEDMAASGALGLNGDLPNIGLCKERVGDKICLMGNVSPHETMAKGKPEEVYAESLRAINDAGKNGGFILTPGCDLDWQVPDENILALVEAAQNYRYD